MSFILILFCLLILILLITWCRLNEFLAFLLVSVLAGIMFRLPADKIIGSVQKGIGDTLGSLVIIICLGAMLGKLVAQSGAAKKIAATLVKISGRRHIQWALMITGFIIGIPLFYGVGFVLMIPLIFSVVYQYKLPAVYVGIPLLAALSVTHGFLPPHPSPTALVQQFHGSMGLTLLYGLVIAIPTIIIAGPLFSRTLKNIDSKPLQTFQPEDDDNKKLPGTINSFITSLLPVFLLILTTALPYITTGSPGSFKAVLLFFSDPAIVLLLSVLVATYTLGIRMGKSMKEIAPLYTQAVKDVAMILLIIA
ncbi:MAG: gluconate transporter, partial [Chitinophagaceae bacterium]|nr:gluconate transporter [Chitinophagaceae bacterium]